MEPIDYSASMPIGLYMTLLFLVILIILLTQIKLSKSDNPPGHFIVSLNDFNIECEKVYDLLHDRIVAADMPKVRQPRVITKPEGGNFLWRRKYLKVSRHSTTCLACAAPFGTKYFFSLWTLERISLWRWLIAHIPVFGPFLENSFWKLTFYKVDNMAMFNTAIHDAFKAVMDEVTDGRVTKEYSKEELRPVLRNVFDRKR